MCRVRGNGCDMITSLCSWMFHVVKLDYDFIMMFSEIIFLVPVVHSKSQMYQFFLLE